MSKRVASTGIPITAVSFKEIRGNIYSMNLQVETIRWGKTRLDGASLRRMRCGNLLVKMSRSQDEVCLASKILTSEEMDLVDQGRTRIDWNQWAVCTGSGSIVIEPSFPNLPVLVEPSVTFSLNPGESKRLFVPVPLTVVVKVPGDLDQPLAEFPTQDLERARFGASGHGESCYHLPLDLGAAIEPSRSHILVPVHIVNESREILPINRICLRTSLLSVFQRGDHFWANESLIRYQGGKSRSRVSARRGCPPEASGAFMVGHPRQKMPFSVMGRTFRSQDDNPVGLVSS